MPTGDPSRCRDILVHTDDRLELTVAVGVDERGRVSGVYLVRNPDKLGRTVAGSDVTQALRARGDHVEHPTGTGSYS
ncbi:hypothetical protein [Arthrobacter sp. TMS2-4]